MTDQDVTRLTVVPLEDEANFSLFNYSNLDDSNDECADLCSPQYESARSTQPKTRSRRCPSKSPTRQPPECLPPDPESYSEEVCLNLLKDSVALLEEAMKFAEATIKLVQMKCKFKTNFDDFKKGITSKSSSECAAKDNVNVKPDPCAQFTSKPDPCAEFKGKVSCCADKDITKKVESITEQMSTEKICDCPSTKGEGHSCLTDPNCSALLANKEKDVSLSSKGNNSTNESVKGGIPTRSQCTAQSLIYNNINLCSNQENSVIDLLETQDSLQYISEFKIAPALRDLRNLNKSLTFEMQMRSSVSLIETKCEKEDTTFFEKLKQLFEYISTHKIRPTLSFLKHLNTTFYLREKEHFQESKDTEQLVILQKSIPAPKEVTNQLLDYLLGNKLETVLKELKSVTNKTVVLTKQVEARKQLKDSVKQKAAFLVQKSNVSSTQITKQLLEYLSENNLGPVLETLRGLTERKPLKNRTDQITYENKKNNSLPLFKKKRRSKYKPVKKLFSDYLQGIQESDTENSEVGCDQEFEDEKERSEEKKVAVSKKELEEVSADQETYFKTVEKLEDFNLNKYIEQIKKNTNSVRKPSLDRNVENESNNDAKQNIEDRNNIEEKKEVNEPQVNQGISKEVKAQKEENVTGRRTIKFETPTKKKLENSNLNKYIEQIKKDTNNVKNTGLDGNIEITRSNDAKQNKEERNIIEEKKKPQMKQTCEEEIKSRKEETVTQRKTIKFETPTTTVIKKTQSINISSLFNSPSVSFSKEKPPKDTPLTIFFKNTPDFKPKIRYNPAAKKAESSLNATPAKTDHLKRFKEAGVSQKTLRFLEDNIVSMKDGIKMSLPANLKVILFRDQSTMQFKSV